MNKTLYVMVGIPGSGKTTYWSKHLSILGKNVVPVTRDGVRFSLLKDGDEYFSKEEEVFSMYINQIKAALELDTVNAVVADATHLNKASRAKLFKSLGDSLIGVKKVAIVMNTDLDTCFERNEKREGRAKVPRGVIRRMSFQIEIPSTEEGFDDIWLIKTWKEE